MKTKLIALIIIGVVLFGSFSFVYALMYDCLNPPAWFKMPKSDIRYCLGLLTNGNLPDYPTWEEYLASKETRPEPVRTPPPEPPFEKEEPFTKIELMFGEKLNDGLVPVIFTEVITNAETLDEIMVWNFELIGHSGDDRGVVWNKLPTDKRIWYEITDDNGQEIIDYTRMPENWGVPDDQHVYEMDCGFFQTVDGESADPTSIPIKNNTSSIYAKNSRIGIYPDSNGEYSFEFASIFEHYVRFPEDTSEIISQESKSCKLTQNIEDDPEGKYTDGYYTKMVFRLEN